ILEGDRRDHRDHDDVNRDRPRDCRALPLPAIEHRCLHATAAPIDAMTRPARRAASAMRSGERMNEMRKKPSPPAPKPDPGITTTPSSSRSRSAKRALGISPGSAIHKYIVARGVSQE